MLNKLHFYFFTQNRLCVRWLDNVSVQGSKAGKAVDFPHIFLAEATLMPATARKRSANTEATRFAHTEEHRRLNEERQNSGSISPSPLWIWIDLLCTDASRQRDIKLSFECVPHIAVECDWERSPFPNVCLYMGTVSPEAAVRREHSRKDVPLCPQRQKSKIAAKI